MCSARTPEDWEAICRNYICYTKTYIILFILYIERVDPDLHFDTESKPVTVINNTGDDGIYFHSIIPSPTENSLDVYVDGISVHRNPYFVLFCSQGIDIECFLYFKDVSNIDNGTVIEIAVGNSDGGVVNAINRIHTSIIKPQGKYRCTLMLLRYII